MAIDHPLFHCKVLYYLLSSSLFASVCAAVSSLTSVIALSLCAVSAASLLTSLLAFALVVASFSLLTCGSLSLTLSSLVTTCSK